MTVVAVFGKEYVQTAQKQNLMIADYASQKTKTQFRSYLRVQDLHWHLYIDGSWRGEAHHWMLIGATMKNLSTLVVAGVRARNHRKSSVVDFDAAMQQVHVNNTPRCS